MIVIYDLILDLVLRFKDNLYQWALFITHSHLLFYFLVQTCSIYFRDIYHLQVALGV